MPVGVIVPRDARLPEESSLSSVGKFASLIAALATSLRRNDVGTVPLADAVGRQRLVPLDSQLLFAARAVGTCMGD